MSEGKSFTESRFEQKEVKSQTLVFSRSQETVVLKALKEMGFNAPLVDVEGFPPKFSVTFDSIDQHAQDFIDKVNKDFKYKI